MCKYIFVYILTLFLIMLFKGSLNADGLQVSGPAPDFQLPDLNGGKNKGWEMTLLLKALFAVVIQRERSLKIMHKKSHIYYLLLIIAMLFNAFFINDIVFAHSEGQWCPLCGMNLKMFQQTNHRLTFNDGKAIQTCSLRCATMIYQKSGDKIQRIEAADYETGQFMDSDKAYYLIGSNLPGTMTAVSKLAFVSQEKAKSFQQDHGGVIGTFNDALEKAIADLPSDNEMIKNNMAKRALMGKDLAAKQGCYVCHGPEGKGGQAIAWNAKEFFDRTPTRIDIKKSILAGKNGMPGFEGKIMEKDLQSIMLYIWSLRPAN